MAIAVRSLAPLLRVRDELRWRCEGWVRGWLRMRGNRQTIYAAAKHPTFAHTQHASICLWKTLRP